MELSAEHVEMLTGLAPSLIPELVHTLNAWRMSRLHVAAPGADPGAKVGRNDPCPCGFGQEIQEVLWLSIR